MISPIPSVVDWLFAPAWLTVGQAAALMNWSVAGITDLISEFAIDAEPGPDGALLVEKRSLREYQDALIEVANSWPTPDQPANPNRQETLEATVTEDQFKKLGTGSIVRHRLTKDVFVVISNYGNRATAVMIADITNPHEWDLVAAPNYHND